MSPAAKTFHTLSQQIQATVRNVINALAVPQSVHATVVSIQTGPPASLTLQLQGTNTGVTGIRYWDSYSPTVADTVVCHRVGTDLYVVAKFA